jgi:predicted phosphodiesterase
MKIQIVSDLHLEFHNDPSFVGFKPALGADVLVLAGDIHVRTQAVERFKGWPVPVIYVYGNHEMYSGHDLSRTIDELRTACADSQVHFLEQQALVLPGFPAIRFLGTCLWTDYLLFGQEKQPRAMRECLEVLNDHSRIRTQGRKFMPRDALNLHTTSSQWIDQQLAVPFHGKTVVVTHHGCHWNSVAPRWRDDLVSAGFCSNLAPLLTHADLWIHGHTHDSFDYLVNRCRVVVNPRGYPLRSGAYENDKFDPSKVVEL